MSYVAIYRKFRPQTFAQVKGQESIVQTLRNQIRNDRIGHAYLFTGTRGTGKTSVARIFAKAINCLHPQDGEPCNECENCKAIAAGSFMDVIEIDAASNTGVDDIRRVIEEVQYTPVAGRYKVYIIDEAHMLTGAASNAFLKTLEEPPAYAIFILATTEPHKLPVTILSRCQRYDFKRITTDKITENIFEYLAQEGIEAEEKAVRYIARIGDGSMRDSLSLLDKAIAFNLGERLTYEKTLAALGTVDTEIFSRIFRSVLNADAYGAVTALDEEIKGGKDISRFVSDFVWYLRNLLLLRVSSDRDFEMLGLSDENLESLKQDATLAEEETLMRYIRILSELSNQLKFSSSRQILADVAVIKLARPQMETDNESVLDRIRQLEAKLDNPVLVQEVPAQTVPVQPAVSVRPSQPVQEAPRHYDPAPKNVEEIPPEFVEISYDPAETYVNLPMEETVYEDTAPTFPAAETTFDNTAPAPPAEALPQAGSGSAHHVCAGWGNILQGCTSPLLKVYLKETSVEAIDETTVCITAGSAMAEDRLNAKRDEIKELIKKNTGCDVEVLIAQPGKAPSPVVQNPAPAFAEPLMTQTAFPGMTAEAPPPEKTAEQQTEEKIEALLKKNIKMNIEMEDA